MRFNLVDRIVQVEPGRSLRAVKNLTLGEEYLADHFPTFPVMPGVLMLQTLVEAGAWLLRLTDDFRHSVIVLRDARNVKYGNLMEPGRRLVLAVELAEPLADPDQPLVTRSEEYLADHFPTFPVMPGVLMLQTLVEAGAWLLRLTDDFRHSVIVLRDARNVKYGNLMEPGRRLVLAVELAEPLADPDQPLVT